MSYEHFETVCAVDARTAQDGRGIDYKRPGEGRPRWLNDDVTINRPSDGTRTWATVTPYAHDLLYIAAESVREHKMDGLTGDHPERRECAARLCEVVAGVVKELARDAACDGPLTDDRWDLALSEVEREVGLGWRA